MPMVADTSDFTRNQREKPRSCFNADCETPKRSYNTKKAAKAAVLKGRNLKPYPCTLHGWHLGTPR